MLKNVCIVKILLVINYVKNLLPHDNKNTFTTIMMHMKKMVIMLYYI